MTNARRSFTAEFKLKIARLVVDQGIDVPDVCKDMELGPTAVRRWLYLAVVMDLYSRKIIGWTMNPTMHTELVSRAITHGN